MEPQPLLELQVHLMNGNTHRFVEQGPERAQKVIEQVQVRVFAQPGLIIAGSTQVVAYPGSALAGISIITDPPCTELLHLGVPNPDSRVVPEEITEEEYRRQRQAWACSTPGEPLMLLHETEMSSGHRFWLRVHIPEVAGGFHERTFLHNLFSLPCLACHRLGGGVRIWNRAHIVRQTFHPRIEVPTSAWLIEPVDE